MAAQPQCEKCGGMGLQQITETLLVPGIDPPNGKPVFEFAVNTVCACVNIERTPGRNPARLCTNNGSWFDYLFKLVGGWRQTLPSVGMAILDRSVHGSGLLQRRPGNLLKSESPVCTVASCSNARAAMCASVTRLGPLPGMFRYRDKIGMWLSVGFSGEMCS